MEMMKNGAVVADAVKSTGLARPTFYKWKPVVELKIVDEQQEM